MKNIFWSCFLAKKKLITTFSDGPRGSLKRLRNQLANDGCPASQVVLAKQLLEEQCGNIFSSNTIIDFILVIFRSGM